MKKFIEFVPLDAAWVLQSIHAELLNARNSVQRNEDGEFDFLPDMAEFIGSAKFYRSVFRDIEERIALLKMPPLERFIDQVTKNHEATQDYYKTDPPSQGERELYPNGNLADKYLKEAYDALNKDDDRAAWEAIIRMNHDLDQLHQPDTLYLPNKRFWPELRLSKEAVTADC